MQIFRFIFPFLYVRNWYNGTWEFSRSRAILFLIALIIVISAIITAHVLQAPIVYTASHSY